MTGNGGRQAASIFRRGALALVAAATLGLGVAAPGGAAQEEDQPLVGGQLTVTMTEGGERTVYVDGPSRAEAECTVTAPDGSVETLEGFENVGTARLGKQRLGTVTADQDGDHVVRCTGVQEAWVGPEDGGSGFGAAALGGLGVILLLAVVLPAAVIGLVVWLVVRRRG